MHRVAAAGRPVESIGKLHFRTGENDHGFDQEHLPMYVANMGVGWPQGLLRDPLPDFAEAAEYARQLGPGPSEYVDYDREITARAVNWLSSPPVESPWVLFVSLVSPHYPLVSPVEFFDRYRNAAIPKRIPKSKPHPVLDEMREFWDYDRYFDGDGQRDHAARNYFGLVTFLDDNVGQILAALDQSGQRDRTAVIYTSDHGDMLGDHGFWAKSVMYEGSVAVPLIVSAPGGLGTVNETPVSLIDLGVTIEQYVGIDTSVRADSKQVEPSPWAARPLQDVMTMPAPDRTILSEYHDGGAPTALFMIRKGSWKYVHYADGSPPQLFDLDGDPTEDHDRATDPAHRPVRQRMEQELRAILQPEDVDRRAAAAKADLVAELGGAHRVIRLEGFNHTPIGS